MDAERTLAHRLDEAARAVERGLTLFRRIEDGAAFSRGAIGRTDPHVAKVRDDVLGTIQSLLPHLLESTDAEGLPLDFDSPLLDETGAPYSSRIGVRGARLCAPLVGFVGALRQEDTHGCVEQLEELRERLANFQADVAAEPRSGDVPVGASTSPEAIHSADFTTVNWFGTPYLFNATQAHCVRLLWAEFERGSLGLSEATIGDKIGSDCDDYRLFHTFRSKTGDHPAWRTMIRKVGPKVYRLCPPDHE